MTPVHGYLLACGILYLAAIVAAEQGQPPTARSPSDWAKRKLPAAGYRIGGGGIRLTRDCKIDGIPCKADCNVSFWWDGGLSSATLARDHTIDGVLMKGGTVVCLRSGSFRPSIERGTPVQDIQRWGLWCAGDHPVDFMWRSGTLARFTTIAGILLPAGSDFEIDCDWDHLVVTLSAPTNVYGHVLGAGVIVEMLPQSQHRPWISRALFAGLGRLFSWERVEPYIVATCAQRWKLFDWFVAEHQRVTIKMDGSATIQLGEHGAHHDGVRYPPYVIVKFTKDGAVRGWEATCLTPSEDHPCGPYR